MRFADRLALLRLTDKQAYREALVARAERQRARRHRRGLRKAGRPERRAQAVRAAQLQLAQAKEELRLTWHRATPGPGAPTRIRDRKPWKRTKTKGATA